MATIANMPNADVQVTFPSGTVRTVNVIVLKAEVLNARSMARFGHPLARNAPTLSAIRTKYEIPKGAARKWADVAPLLEQFHADLTAAIDEALANAA